MRLKDFLTEEEDMKLQELKVELIDAPNDKERTQIMTEIDDIFNTARSRYHALINGKDEQAASYEIIRPSPYIGVTVNKEQSI